MSKHRSMRSVLMAGSRVAMVGMMACSLLAPSVPAFAQSAAPTPESFFGHRMGTDRELEPYNKLVA